MKTFKQLRERNVVEGSRTPQDWEVKSAVWGLDKRGVHQEPQDVKSHFVRADRSSRAEKKAKREYEPGRQTWEIHPRGNKQQGVAEANLSELNKDTVYSYAKKADKDQDKQSTITGKAYLDNDPKTANKAHHKFSMRAAGLDRAEKRLNKEGVAEGIGDTLAAFKAKNPGYTVSTDNKTPAQRRADTDKMLAARAAAKPKVTNQPSKPSTPEQQMKNQNASMAASYAKHRPGQYVGDSVELEGDSINEDHYERAEDSKTLANTAKNEGDEIGFNSHMADHHDHLSQWHEEKGRASAAQSHADKSEMYANKMTQVAKGVTEALSAAARMQKALQKAKEDRERSERNAERLLNPVKKPAPIEQVKEGTFKYHMDKAIAANEKGDLTRKAYHLENARTAKFAMPSKDYAKNKELLDKHKQMSEEVVSEEKPGLYANIHAKRKRIAAGSGERMRKPGSKGAPTAKAFKQAQKTVKENIDDGVNEGIARLISKSIKNVTATKKTPQEKADIRLNNLNK
jgi:hypothetical protein